MICPVSTPADIFAADEKTGLREMLLDFEVFLRENEEAFWRGESVVVPEELCVKNFALLRQKYSLFGWHFEHEELQDEWLVSTASV